MTESARLQLLADYGVMDSAADETLDEIVALAAAICETPIALISLVDDTRQWWKARIGLDVQQTPRDQAFCAHAVDATTADLLVVADARKDARFADNPLVVGDPKIVFYAGAPLVVEGGAKLGTLCVIDREPRVLTATQTMALGALSKLAVERLRARRDAATRDASEARMAAVLGSISEAVVSTDLTGRVTLLNPVAELLLGKSLVEAAGVPVDGMLHIVQPDGDTRAEDLARLALQEGRIVARPMPALLRRPTGESVPVLDSAAPIRNARGEITGAVVVLRDLSESTILLAAREKAELELQRIFALSADILVTSRGGYFTKVNPALPALLGWTEAELLNRPIGDLDHPDDAVRTAEQRNACAHGADLRAYESRYRHKDGSHRWISWNATSAEGTTYAVGRDVTADKALALARKTLSEQQHAARQAAERATQVMDAFLATVSHELRTPLNAMLGWTRLLREGDLSEEQAAKALVTIERNAVAQAKLIGDLLDVSRIISGKMRLDLVTVDLVRVIEAALDVVRPAAGAKGVQLRAILDPAASHVTGDESRLQQVVWNLLSNAVKFTPKNGHVDVRLLRAASSVEIIVTDDGAGIPAAFLAHVFERFRQEDGAITRTHGGLGLGLAIVKNILELHGGSVRAESEGAGKGASFIVSLPLSLVGPEVAAHPRVETAAAFGYPTELQGVRLLVVDDEQDARDLLVTILRQCGAEVSAAGSAAEAFAAFRIGSFAVVISDVGMPGEDGYSLVKKIRQLPAGEGGRTPVIALTAYARAEDRTRVLRSGFSSHVAKPVDPQELLAVIASFLDRPSNI